MMMKVVGIRKENDSFCVKLFRMLVLVLLLFGYFS